jgi:hypothetical protein
MANTQMNKLDKAALNAKQIAKYANSKKLVDVVDNIDSIHSVKGTYNKKVVVTVNEFDKELQKNHKEKYAAFFWDIQDALLISDDIINNRFENEIYMGTTPGSYMKFGGGAVSRILTISYKDGKYLIQVALFEAIQGKNGQIQPNKEKPIDKHNIQLPKQEARKFFMSVYATILSKMGKLTELPGQATPTPQQAPINATKEAAPVKPAEQPAPKNNSDDFDPFEALGDEGFEF